MEFINALSPLMVASLSFFLLFLFVLLKSTKSSKSPDIYSHVPGPKKLPFIGNLHLMLSGAAAPHRLFRDLALKYGPFMHLQLGQLHFLIVSSAELAREVVKTHDVNFANRPRALVQGTLSYDYSDLAFAPYGDGWRHLRKICTLELLSLRRVQSFRPIREKETMNLARWLTSSEGLPVDLSERLGLLSYDVITRATVGAKTVDDKGEVISILQDAARLSSGLNLADLFPSAKLLPLITGFQSKIRRMRRKMDRVFDRVIDEHRAAPRKGDGMFEDLVDVLLKIQEDGRSNELPLTTGNIKGVLMDMFIAGTDTSVVVEEWAMAHMMRNPSILERAQEEVRRVFDDEGRIKEEKLNELRYLKLVIKETMRMHAPAPFLIPKMNSERCEINGYEIPARSTVIINAWALGRDPKVWNEPEKFVPERFEESSVDYKGNNFEFIPFGAGRRICPGISFAMANIESTLAMLLYHFDWKKANNEEMNMAEVFGGTVKMKHHLHLVPSLKRPLPAILP